jgi:anaerobic magnesium-protoporphyrin IX monomethyl ester cyclase
MRFSMVDVLLAHSYYLKYDPKQTAKMRPYPPLATLYAAAVLREAGYSVALFDAMFADGEREFAKALEQHRPRFVMLYEDSFNFLVKMCLTRMREAAQCMAQVALAGGATVVAAGPDVTDNPEQYLHDGVQYAMIGEADHTVRELLDCLAREEDRSVASITGLAYLDGDGDVHFTAKRASERKPDNLPLPAWDLVDVERYRRAWTGAHGYFSLNIVSTRGCPYHCNWCAKPIWGQQYAMRSAASVAEEMTFLKRAYRPDHLWFADDIFGLRPSWVEEFAREVTARGAAVPFTIQTRVDRMTEQAVSGLAKAGCAEVWLGAESGSQRILDAMDKGMEADAVHPAVARLRHAGIKVGLFIQLGYPGETFDDIRATAQMVRECLPDNIGVSVSYPLPGTRFHDRVRAQLGVKTHWTDSGDLEMMFRGTYTSGFYRKLHRLLHEELDVRRAQDAHNDRCADETIIARLDKLSAEWVDLERTETEFRHKAPTQLRFAPARPQAPDLSRSYGGQ